MIAECQKNGWNVAVAVVDNHGILIHFERMDNTQTASTHIAVGKVTGGVGVSGVTGDQDAQCSKAGFGAT